MVRDVVTRQVVAHFRAHTAPLLLLRWDGSGTLLVTASVHGHNINIFQVHACSLSPACLLACTPRFASKTDYSAGALRAEEAAARLCGVERRS